MHILHQVDVLCLLTPYAVYWIYALSIELAGHFWFSANNLEIQSTINNQKHKTQSPPPSKPHIFLNVLLQQIILASTNGLFLLFIDGSCHEQELPNIFTMCIQFVFCMLVLDTWQYWMHRLMHQNMYLYHHFHSWHHSMNIPFASAALYNHPVEGFLMDATSGLVSLILVGPDPRLFALFACLCTMKTVDDHCNFALRLNPLQWFSNNAKYHDVHHRQRYFKFNYSQPFFTHWDRWCGTMFPSEDGSMSKWQGGEMHPRISFKRS